jgi:hypothetical protein
MHVPNLLCRESRYFARNGRKKRRQHIGCSFRNPETQNSKLVTQQESRVDLTPLQADMGEPTAFANALAELLEHDKKDEGQ